MNGYDAINDEIKNFLALTEKQPKENVEPIKETSSENLSSLVALLTNLQNVYNDINTNLIARDNEGLKDKLLNSEVKMSLVCESLMRVLKDVCQEKNELVQSEEKYKERVKNLLEEKEGSEIKVSRMESDLDFANRGNQELSRIIKDLKNKIQGFKEKAELEKRNCDSFRSINEELEILRKKALERCDVYEKEIMVLKQYLKEKTDEVGKMKNEIKRIDAEKEVLSKRMIGYEKSNELLRKKLEIKENGLGLCNSELSKLISKERRMESELEGLKEKAAYYERLYKATNNQNEYLNSQLARIISMGGGDKIELPEYDPESQQSVVQEKADTRTSDKSHLRSLKRYKRKSLEQKEVNEGLRNEIQDLKLMLERLKDENARLREEKTKAMSSNSKITDDLMNKVERLLEKNREYQNVIYELKGKDIGTREAKKADVDESFKTVNDEEFRNDFSIRNTGKDRIWEMGDNLKPFVLEGDYNKEMVRDEEHVYDLDGSRKRKTKFDVSNIQSRLRSSEKQDDGIRPNSPIRMNIPDKFYTSLVSPEKNEDDSLVRRNVHPVDPFDSAPNEINRLEDSEDKLDRKIESCSSSTSPKTVRTTSTLHEMLRRTDALKGKFDKLEEQLHLIKNSDKADTDKVRDQIKAYKNYYYSDYLDTSNKLDFI